ncbi:MAG: carbon-nitrogen hydrolase family protein [Fimbriimonadaceae bacterium]|nr:MAG: putative amidohydrolase [Armatimonadetes bacterium OLB18]WKZ81232.1 MAG: carbon-nitrogen hydrolase family protein [Fimbriimonadaceae bacterium]
MKLACLQWDVRFGEPLANAERAARELGQLASEGVDLAVFPEAFLTGYAVESLEEAREMAIPRNHPALELLREASDRECVGAVVGFAESGEEAVFNAAAIFEPGRSPRYYRKTHMPCLGLDRFAEPGDRLEVFETQWGRIGVLICFDLRMPEPSRVLALKGAQLILLPTNWPEGAEAGPGFVLRGRCAENRIFMAGVNRVGEEKGFRFIGRSLVADPVGRILANAGEGEERLIVDLDLAEADVKRNVIVPGKFETEILAARHPELYGPITDELPG